MLKIYNIVSLFLSIPLSLLFVELLHRYYKIKRYGVIYSCLFFLLSIFITVDIFDELTFKPYSKLNFDYMYMVCAILWGTVSLLVFRLCAFSFSKVKQSTSKIIFILCILFFFIPALFIGFTSP
jgi:hypothetical protein